MKMFANANAIINSIEKRKNRGYGLEHFKKYMETLGNPHEKLKSIHIAGTNGKGSTTNYTRSILQQVGYKVGTFTSPYMITHLDRIRINDAYMEEDAFIDLVNTYYDSWMSWDLSMFEIDMCLAVLYFLQEQVDYAVFEVGLGGRLDATNILIPCVSVITNIGLDHMEILGDTYEKIAEEKAGIVKRGVDLLTGEHKESCLRVFMKHTQRALSVCIEIEEPSNIKNDPLVHFDYAQYRDIQLSTSARYQAKNASLAFSICVYLQQHDIAHIEELHIRKGLEEAIWIGRFEVVSRNPYIVLDGAHNAHGIQALCENLKDMKHVQIIFSVLKDKNFEEMLEALECVSENITVCHFQNERALDVQILKDRPYVWIVEDYKVAIQQAIEKKQPIVITGSLYFISEVRKYLFAFYA